MGLQRVRHDWRDLACMHAKWKILPDSNHHPHIYSQQDFNADRRSQASGAGWNDSGWVTFLTGGSQGFRRAKPKARLIQELWRQSISLSRLCSYFLADTATRDLRVICRAQRKMKIQDPFKIHSEFQDSDHRTSSTWCGLFWVGVGVGSWWRCRCRTGRKPPLCHLEANTWSRCLPMLKEAPARGPVLGEIIGQRPGMHSTVAVLTTSKPAIR